MSEPSFYEILYPSSRQFTFDFGKLGREKHHVKALLQVDVTEARLKIKQHRQGGAKISFIAWLVKTIADSVALHPAVNGVNRPRRNRVAVFKDVDVSIVIEKEVNGVRVPLPYVIRSADKKTVAHIQQEIESAKSQFFQDEGDYVLGKKNNPVWMRAFLRLPQWLRIPFMRTLVFNNPQRLKDAMGTVMITTVGMAGRLKGWIIPYSAHPLCFALGSLNEQPAVHCGEICKREILHLTVLIDHDAVDGIPAARFVDELVKKLERGAGVEPLES